MRATIAFVGRMPLIIVLALAVCVLMQTPVVKAKDHPVTRPFKIKGVLTFLDLTGGPPWAGLDKGVASEFGQYVDVAKYTDGNHGFGVYFTANGDQIFWEDNGGGVITFTGGTGRFQGVTGEYTLTTPPPVTALGPSGTVTLIYTYTGAGNITY